MRETQFFLESLGNYEFEGYTRDEEWNGWACPYFSYEQAEKIARIHSEVWDTKVRYDSGADKFVFGFSDETEEYTAVDIGGKKLYPIGTCVWIWEEKE